MPVWLIEADLVGRIIPVPYQLFCRTEPELAGCLETTRIKCATSLETFGSAVAYVALCVQGISLNSLPFINQILAVLSSEAVTK